MPGRRSLPHECPSWADPASEVWFITICCQTRGGNKLANAQSGPRILESAAFLHERLNWYAHLFLLMPDHCHALLSFPGERPMAKTIRDWKRWISRELQIDWQTDFFEHRLRHEESFSQKWDYILQNPVRAGLARKAEDWRYVWRAV